MNTLTNVSIVDCHTHIYNIEAIDKLAQLVEALKLEGINVLSLSADGKEFIAQNLICGLFKGLFPDKTYCFGGLYYPFHDYLSEILDFAEQAKRLIEMGFDGMKMIEGKPDSRKRINQSLDSPAYDKYYAFLEKEKIPLLYHVADPADNWDIEKVSASAVKEGWFYGNGDFLSRKEIYCEVEGILRKFPNLKIIFAHFFFMSENIMEAEAFLEKWPSIHFDLTPGSEMYGDFGRKPKQWKDFFIKYQDRILFGTDNEYGDSENVIETIRTFLETERSFKYWNLDIKGLNLPKVVLDKIYHGNFYRLAGKSPRKLNKQLLLEEYDAICKAVGNKTEDDTVKQQLLEIGKRLEKI